MKPWFRSGCVVAGLVAALVFAAAAWADSYTIRYAARDQQTARSVVLRRADFGSGWTGGTKQPDLKALSCPNFRPKESDLVVTAAARSSFSRHGELYDGQVTLLKTPGMVKLDWQRSVATPKALSCLRSSFKIPANATLVSLKRLSLPIITPNTDGYRALVDIHPAGTQAGTLVRLMFDTILVAQGRAEIALATIAYYAKHESVWATELRLARLLAARAGA